MWSGHVLTPKAPAPAACRAHTCSLSGIYRPDTRSQDTNQFIGNLVGWIVIYIIHKQYRHNIKRLQLSKDTVPNHRVFTSTLCLSGDVRTMQLAIMAQSRREMSQTDRIHPRYFLLRVRVSIRPRYFVNAKKP